MSKRLRLIYFVVRWWLIGRYHCDLPSWTIPMWWFLHKLLWFSIAYSLIYTNYKIWS